MVERVGAAHNEVKEIITAKDDDCGERHDADDHGVLLRARRRSLSIAEQ